MKSTLANLLIATVEEIIVDFLSSIWEKTVYIIPLKMELNIELNVKGEFCLFLPLESAERHLKRAFFKRAVIWLWMILSLSTIRA